MNEHDEVCKKDDLGRIHGQILDEHIRGRQQVEEEKMPYHADEDIDEFDDMNQRNPANGSISVELGGQQ